MKTIFIVSAICAFLATFWLAYYTYQKTEVANYKKSKRDRFLLIASILIILYTIIELAKITFFSAFLYSIAIFGMYIGLLSTLCLKYDVDFFGFIFIGFLVSIVFLLLTLCLNFTDETKEDSTEVVRLENSDSTENIVIIKLISESGLKPFCIMKKLDDNYELPLELSSNNVKTINISETEEEKLEIKNNTTYSYDLLSYFGFKEPEVSKSTHYSLYINKDSIRYE